MQVVTPESNIIVPNQGITQLDPNARAQIERMMRDGWRLTPATCANRITNGRWKAARHLKYISNIIATEIAKGDARIIVTMPARHGKSEFLSVHTPIWFLERWPHKYVMTLSYGADLATDFSYKVRNTFLNEDLHGLLTTRLDRNKLKIDRFLTTKEGGVTAAGIGGTITGRGGDLLLIDDYIKNAEQAMSITENKKIWEWFRSTAYTRLEPGGSIIILATRWSQNDLIERVITEMAHENWIVITLPALAEANDPLGREVGEALWPERFSKQRLEAIRASLGGFWWSAMYQQKPKASMAGQDLGDKLQTIPWSEVGDVTKMKIVRPWDFASQENAGDWTVGPKMVLDDHSGRTVILEMERFQGSPKTVESKVNEVANRDGTGVKIWIEQEPGSAGTIVIDHYCTQILKGFAAEGERATGRIEVRASPFLADVESGKVVAVQAPWNKVLRDELNAFPDGEHDDQIAACSLGHLKLNGKMYTNATFGRGDGTGLKMKRSYENEGTVSRGVVFGRNIGVR